MLNYIIMILLLITIGDHGNVAKNFCHLFIELFFIGPNVIR